MRCCRLTSHFTRPQSQLNCKSDQVFSDGRQLFSTRYISRSGIHSSAGFAEAENGLSQFISELVDVVCTYAWNVLQPFRELNSNC